jgi:preprotein translocase subunit SecA
MNDQRKVIYEQRKELMTEEDVSHTITDMRHHVIEELVARHIPEKAYAEQWNIAGLHAEMLRIFNLNLPLEAWAKEEGIADAEIRERLIELADRKMAEKAANYGPGVMRMVEKSLLLQILDQIWKEHLLNLDHLRQGIGLRAYAQRDPLNEYKREAFNLFEGLLDRLRERVTLVLAHVELQTTPQAEMLPRQPRPEMHETRVDPAFDGAMAAEPEPEMAGAAPRSAPGLGTESGVAPVRSRQATGDLDPGDPSTWGRIARNTACPCGSGKKYKHCHGSVA